MLTGADLLAKVKELGDASKSDLVRGCGTISTKKAGTERLNLTAFYEALLEAKGMNLGAGAAAEWPWCRCRPRRAVLQLMEPIKS
jgi:hypothetical protein